MPASGSIAVVVLNWNNAPDTLACLESLRRSMVAVRTVVVDNASTDGSVDAIRRSGLADTVLLNTDNLGFAGGNNVGIRRALDDDVDWIMVLNNDTVVSPTAVGTLLDVAAARARAAVSPHITYHSSTDIWFAGGFIDRGWPRHLREDEITRQRCGVHATPLLTGCCMLASAATWRVVGLFDERYFLIFEDSDWSMRARAAATELLVVDDAVIEHRVSRSFRSGPAAWLGRYYFARNGLRFHLRWQRRFAPWFVWNWVVRPGAAALARRAGRREATFGALGAFAALCGRSGRAGSVSSRLADRFATSTASR